jgi:hypothetical protein
MPAPSPESRKRRCRRSAAERQSSFWRLDGPLPDARFRWVTADLPPVLVKKLAPKGMRASRRYRVPPMPFSLSAAQLADLANTVPGIHAVHDLPMPRGRGPVFGKLFPAFWQLELTKQFRGAYTCSNSADRWRLRRSASWCRRQVH